MVVGWPGDVQSRHRVFALGCALVLIGTGVALWPEGVDAAGRSPLVMSARQEQRSLLQLEAEPILLEEPLPTREQLAAPDPKEMANESRSPALLALISQLVSDLEDDDIPHTAGKALDRLRMLGAQADPELEDALWSPDEQQRFLAATILAEMDRKPTDRLLDVLTHMLRNDASVGYHQTTLRTPFRVAAYYLSNHAREAIRDLENGLYADRENQRFYSAVLLAGSGLRTRIPEISRELIPHLADNYREGDAIMSSQALYRLGPGVMPYLQDAREHADTQMTQLIDLILLDLERPPANAEELRSRQKMQSITNITSDPLVESEFGAGSMPSWGS